MSDVLTTPEVAVRLGCSPRTVHRRVFDGQITALRRLPGPNGGFLFEPAEVERFREEQRKQKAARTAARRQAS